MKTSLFLLLISCLITTIVSAQTDAEQLAASFDKSKIKHKAKYGVEVNRALVTRHEVANVNDLSFYKGHYVGIEGTYEITLAVKNQELSGQFLQPNADGKSQIIPLSNIRIADGLFTADAGHKSLKGVFINQGRVDTGHEQISFGLGIIDPQLPNDSMNRIFCVRK